MADFYPTEFVGGPDGSAPPPKKLDGRLVGAKKRSTRAAKPAGQALAVGDRLYFGKVPAGAIVRRITCNSNLFPHGVSIGTTAQPTKYVTNISNSTANVPNIIGPNSASAIAAPLAADEELWITIVTNAVAAATTMSFELDYSIST